MSELDKLSRKELITEITHLQAEQEEYESNLSSLRAKLEAAEREVKKLRNKEIRRNAYKKKEFGDGWRAESCDHLQGFGVMACGEVICAGCGEGAEEIFHDVIEERDELKRLTENIKADIAWIKIMDFCKKNNIHPSNANELFNLVSTLRSAEKERDDLRRRAENEEHISGKNMEIIGHKIKIIRRLEATIAQMRGALEWYAKTDNYGYTYQSRGKIIDPAVFDDNGEIARQALYTPPTTYEQKVQGLVDALEDILWQASAGGPPKGAFYKTIADNIVRISQGALAAFRGEKK